MINSTSHEPLHSDSANAATARLWCAEPETRSRRGRLAGCLGQSLIQQLYCLDTAQTGFKQHSWGLHALAETDSYGRQQVGDWPRPALASGPEIQPAWGRTQCQQKACARAGALRMPMHRLKHRAGRQGRTVWRAYEQGFADPPPGLGMLLVQPGWLGHRTLAPRRPVLSHRAEHGLARAGPVPAGEARRLPP